MGRLGSCFHILRLPIIVRIFCVYVQFQISYLFSLHFNWLYIHSGLQDITSEACQGVLIETLFSRNPTLVELTRAVCLLTHGISGARQQDEVLKAHFNLLARLFVTAKAVLPAENLKDIFFGQSAIIKDILMSPASSNVLEGVVISHTTYIVN